MRGARGRCQGPRPLVPPQTHLALPTPRRPDGAANPQATGPQNVTTENNPHKEGPEGVTPGVNPQGLRAGATPHPPACSPVCLLRLREQEAEGSQRLRTGQDEGTCVPGTGFERTQTRGRPVKCQSRQIAE